MGLFRFSVQCTFLFTHARTRLQIVGLESWPTKTPSQPRQILYAHLDALRRMEQFRDCRFLLVPEANLGDQAQLLAQMALRRYRDVDVLCQHSECYGIFTKPGDPEKYVARMRNKFSEDGVFFNDKIVSVNPYRTNATNKQRVDAVMTEFKRQLVAFRAIHIVPAALTGQVRVIYSGKADKDNKRSNRSKDDMVMAFLFGYYYYGQYTGPLTLVNKRDSHNMLRFDTLSGTAVETGRSQRNGRRRTRLDDTLAGDDGSGGDDAVRESKRRRTRN